MKRIRFRLSTLLLLTACVAAGFATQNRRNAWYISKSVPHGLGETIHVVASETQDLLVGGDGSDELVVCRLSTGEVLREFDDVGYRFDSMQAGQDGEIYGVSSYSLSRIDLKTGESIELMTTSDGPPEQELIRGVSPDGSLVFTAVRGTVAMSARYTTPTTYRIRDLTSGELRWELPTEEESHDSYGAFSADGQRIGIQIGNRYQVWDFWRNEKIHDSSLHIGDYPPVGLFPDGRRAFGQYVCVFDLERGTLLARVGHGYFGAIVNDSLLITEDKGKFYYWRRRRVEGSWSPLNFPEAWITGMLAIACALNVVGYPRRRNGHGGSCSPDEPSA